MEQKNIVFLVVGIVVGPVLSAIFGLQVSAGSLEDEVKAVSQKQKAICCAIRATDEVGDTRSLNDADLKDLAKRMAREPGQPEPSYEAMSRCRDLLQ